MARENEDFFSSFFPLQIKKYTRKEYLNLHPNEPTLKKEIDVDVNQ